MPQWALSACFQNPAKNKLIRLQNIAKIKLLIHLKNNNKAILK